MTMIAYKTFYGNSIVRRLSIAVYGRRIYYGFMSDQLHKGQWVTVNAFPGKRPTVIVVEDRGDVVLICKQDEYMAAIAEGRAPIAVGFHREDVLDVVGPPKKGASSEVPIQHRSSMAGD
jgi:hypothetical protein